MSLPFSISLSLSRALTPSEKLRLVFKHGGLANLAQVYANKDLWDTTDQRIIQKLKADFPLNRAKVELEQLAARGAWAIALGDVAYPSLLSQIPNPPLVLFGEGQLPDTRTFRLGFVGPRKPTAYGIRIAKWLAKDLVTKQFILVSGLAKGIDAIAHTTSVDLNAATVAVLGHGLDHTYPSEHVQLRKDIVRTGGCVLTEYPLGTEPTKYTFPQRNRIISGLSSGVVVVEASEVSGARITATCAVDQGREVYAVPGPIDSPTSTFTNQLLADGAKLVRSAESIMEDFDFSKAPLVHAASLLPRFPDPEDLSREEQAILDCLEGSSAMSVDQIQSKSRHATPEVMAALAALEIKGMITQQADARYVRKV